MRTGSIDTLSNLLNTNWLNHLLIILTLCYQHIRINTISSSIWNCGICQHHKKVQALTYTHWEKTKYGLWVSTVCVLTIDIGKVGLWQGAERRPCPRRLIVSTRIEGTAKEKWLHASFYFPHLGCPLDRAPTQSGKQYMRQWKDDKRELEGHRDL